MSDETKPVEGQQAELDVFAGWSDTEEEVFFSSDEGDTEEGNDDSSEEEEGEELTPEQIKAKKEAEDAEAALSFGDPSEEEEDDEEDKPEKSKKKGTKIKSSSLETLDFLKEKGIVDYELEEGEELDEETALEKLEDAFEEKVDSKIQQLFKDLPDEIKQLNKYALSGGDVQEYLKTLATPDNLPEKIDISNESHQEVLVKKSLEQQGFDAEYIKDQIDYLKDKGKLEDFSKKVHDKLEKDKKEEQQALLEQQTLAKEKARKQRKKTRAELEDLINSEEDFKGIKLSRKAKKELPSYMNDLEVETTSGSKISAFQADFYKVMNNKIGAVQLAEILRNSNKNGELDFKTIEKNLGTKVAQKALNSVREANNLTPSRSTERGSRSNVKSLADIDFD